MNNTNYVFKLLYAIGIVFIVAGHCNGGGFSLFYEFFPLYAFHVGLFVFSSGYFYNYSNETNVKSYVIKKLKHLILPLYLWNIFYALIIYFIKSFGFFPTTQVTIQAIFLDPILHGHQFVLNSAGWFVIPIFMTHILNIMVRKIFRNFNIKINELIYFEISLAMGCLGVYLAYLGYHQGWYLVLDRVLYFIPFYSLGILYKTYEKYDKINSLIYFSIILTISLVCIYAYNGMPAFSQAWCDNFTSNPTLPFIVGFLGIAFWLRIAKILVPSIGKNKHINIVANNTYSIMINHYLGFMLLKTCFYYLSKYTAHFHDFNITEYKTNLYYYYLPHNLHQMHILYLIVGILFSIMLQVVINKLFEKLLKLQKNAQPWN